MLTHAQRVAVLELHRQGLGSRKIAKALKVSRASVKTVIRSKSAQPPPFERPRKAEPHRQQILELYHHCQGNLVRVREELEAQGIEIAYPTLTAFCRAAGIGQPPPQPAGNYPFEPGQEMQHDTSLHTVTIGGQKRKVQTASAVLCYSRMLFVQCYPRFRRFECKTFLTEALRAFSGAPRVVMIDNTHVIVLRGTGAAMVPAPEMEAFSRRLGFRFEAHEIGDVNRSAHVERSFSYFENNFLAGRTFEDWHDLNQKARQWCEQRNQSYKRHLKARPVELFALEATRLRPLPAFVPEPDRIHQRMVSVEGYVALDTHQYSVPVAWIGRPVQVRETPTKVEIRARASLPVVIHDRVIDPGHGKTTLPEHRVPRGHGRKRRGPSREERILAEIAPELGPYVERLKTEGKKQTVLALRQLLRMVRDYPREPLRAAVERADRYRLYDLDRVERMTLERIADDYFQLDPQGDDDD